MKTQLPKDAMWIDEHRTLHFSIIKLLTFFGLAHTRQNADKMELLIKQLCQAGFPEKDIIDAFDE